MRTLIRGDWVVGYDGQQHQVFQNGVCVVEDDRVLHVGKDYDGPVDAEIGGPGMLVSPGLIGTHMHAGYNANDYAFLDRGRPEAMARNYLNWQAHVKDKPRKRADYRTGVLFTMGQALRHGATTVVENGCAGNPPAFVELVDELGIRAYTGPAYRNVAMFSYEDGRLDYDWSDERGEQGFRAAIEFAEKYDGAAGGRVKAMLGPGHPDTCSLQLLEETARQMRQNGLPVTIHAAINPPEMDRTLEMYRLTPIQVLEKVGLLGTGVILSHVLFLSSHSWSWYREAPDLELLGQTHATVSHSPLKYFHMGAHLESLRRYIEAGVNMTIGIDFHPGDIIEEARLTMLLSRVADRNFLSGTPRDVFDAATVNAAKALGRDDLGFLAPGAKADVVLFDMRKMHIGAVHDPIKSLIETGHGSDADTVMVDGRVVVRGGKLVNVDQDALLPAVQGEAEKLWDDVPNWSWGARGIDDMVPPSYPVH